ncbi:MAG TPA: isopentenyl phosphate kinase [Thermoplasmata archaeon]|nr:isopentenyl phosphate kinase [Thermoplasmata archaeon]
MDLVKLGGSVITDKSRLRTFRQAACDRLASELRAAGGELLLAHGAGSFGHIEAKRHSLHKGFKNDSQLTHVAAVQRDVRELNLKVLSSLINKGIRAVSVPPATSARFRNGEIIRFNPEPFKIHLKLGLAPVTFGDVVPDEKMGFSICSGDLMMESLAKHFRPGLVIFCADVDGMFDKDPKRFPDAELMPVLDRAALKSMKQSASRDADVTGSMHGKLERMLAISQHCEKCMIVNGNVPGRLGKALRGREVVCTRVVPG